MVEDVPPKEPLTLPAIHTVDYHTCGEVFRIVADPPVEPAGRTVAERRRYALADRRTTLLRDLLALEPRGHSNTYGGFVVPPDDAGADLGVLFWSQDGYATACGHGTIALATWAVQTGRVSGVSTGVTDVVVDMPSGRATARVHTDRGRVTEVDFVNVPSYVVEREVALRTSWGGVTVDIAFGGALFAHVDAGSLGVRIVPENSERLTAMGQEVRRLLLERSFGCPGEDGEDRATGVYGVILFERLGTTADGDLVQRNAVVFGDRQIDRSPCGSGTSSRLAVLTASGELPPGRELVHESIVGSRFVGRVRGTVRHHDRDAVLPEVTGSAHRIGSSVVEVDPFDDLVPGFSLR